MSRGHWIRIRSLAPWIGFIMEGENITEMTDGAGGVDTDCVNRGMFKKWIC